MYLRQINIKKLVSSGLLYRMLSLGISFAFFYTIQPALNAFWSAITVNAIGLTCYYLYHYWFLRLVRMGKNDFVDGKKYSYFIGRYQPLHEGHIKLIKTVLDEGKNVCVALRATPIQETDPYSIEERRKMFYKAFQKEINNGTLRVIPIPDIEEIVYGRKVGWGVREIRLDESIESISATKIRNGGIAHE